MSKPTPEALEALRLSGEVWNKKLEDFREGKQVSFDGKDCPCCRLFYSFGSCAGCAIQAFTKRNGCDGTPYFEAVDMYAEVVDGGECDPIGRTIAAERDFLKQLYEYYTLERK